MFFRGQPRQTFDLIVEEPAPGEALRRLQRFAGFVQSGARVPPFSVKLDGIDQPVFRKDLGDPSAPRNRRHTAYWRFHLEIPAKWAYGDVEFEILADAGTIARTTFRHAAPDDRAGPLVLMMHIPKTAGTSLRLAVEKQSHLRLLRIYDDPEFLSNARCAGLVNSAAFNDLDIVFGHYPYGLHRSTQRLCRYTTILRHPADVLKSGYLFNKYLIGTETFQHFASIDDAISSLNEGVDNVMTRFISGKTSPGWIDDSDLAIACDNMERDFAYVGSVENMDASLRLLGDIFGVRLASFAINQTPKSPEGETIARDSLMARFDRFLKYDMQLYDRAEMLFRDGVRL